MRGLEISYLEHLVSEIAFREIQAVMQMNLSFQRNAELYYAQHGFPVDLQIAMLILVYKSTKKFATFALTKPVVMNKNPAHQNKALTLFLKRLTPTMLKKILTE